MKEKMSSSIRPSTMGTATLIQSVVQVMVFPFADRIIHIVGGEECALEISIFSYVVRFAINSYAKHPSVILFTQTLHCLGFSLFWSAAIKYTRKIASQETYITTFAVVNSAYFGLGGLLANLLGGAVYSRFGSDGLFRGMSIFSFLWVLVMVFVFQGRTWLDRRQESKPLRQNHETAQIDL